MCSHPINKSLNRLKVSFLFRCTIMLGKQIKTTTNQPKKPNRRKTVTVQNWSLNTIIVLSKFETKPPWDLYLLNSM